jgi:hypothetical protein
MVATDSNVAITAGSGTPIDTILLTGGDHRQVVSWPYLNAAPSAPTSWTVTTAGLANVVAADNTRQALIVCSAANGRVWIRFDATLPTSTAYSTFVDPDQTLWISGDWAARAVSLTGQAAGGFVLLTAGVPS